MATASGWGGTAGMMTGFFFFIVVTLLFVLVFKKPGWHAPFTGT